MGVESEPERANSISAQVSLYPLRPEHLDAVIESAIEQWRTRRLDVYPGAMSTIIAGDEEEVWAALRDAFTAAAVQCETVMVVTLSNTCPVPAKEAEEK
jgi:uncharacterized protein YqgV (UPF0045/DUF77 family)